MSKKKIQPRNGGSKTVKAEKPQANDKQEGGNHAKAR